jgi:hypothetical protein
MDAVSRRGSKRGGQAVADAQPGQVVFSAHGSVRASVTSPDRKRVSAANLNLANEAALVGVELSATLVTLDAGAPGGVSGVAQPVTNDVVGP